MNLKNSFLIAISLSIIGLAAWESYWRSQGFYPTLDDNKDLWAVQRSRVNKASKDDVVLLGSSRVLFDIQLDEWENETGKRPIQLASAGTTPLPALRDIVENTDYNGTIIVGVTPPLFFSTTFPMAPPWQQIQERVDYFKDRTFAQKSNHALSIPLQKNLAFLSEVEGVDGLNLKQLLSKIKVGQRIPDGMPPFYEFSDISQDRNTKMRERTVTDTVFSNTIKKIWKFFGKEAKPPEKEATMKFFSEDVKKFIARGGNLILLRCPSTGYYKEIEAQFFPRAEFWEVILKENQLKGYHFNDYEQLNHFDCPEWSHLSSSDAATFTTELAKIMMKEGVLNNSKTN